MEHILNLNIQGLIGIDDIVYKNERKLYILLVCISTIFWALLVIGSIGMIFFYLIGVFLVLLFTQSALISYIKGTAVEIKSEQFPELYKQYMICCSRLEIMTPPRAYILAADGFLNAFATRFLNRHYVVLYSSVVDALASDKDAINFYIGHELGHIRRGHIIKALFLMLVRWLPLIGAAYSRACEYTCDLHGLRCCNNERSALNAVAVLAAGVQQWKHINVDQYINQAGESGGFWMSLHELSGNYPWLTKRMAHIQAKIDGQEYAAPRRSVIAYLFSLFIPNVATGSFIMIVILAIIFSPAYIKSKSEISLDLKEYQEQSMKLFDNYHHEKDDRYDYDYD